MENSDLFHSHCDFYIVAWKTQREFYDDVDEKVLKWSAAAQTTITTWNMHLWNEWMLILKTPCHLRWSPKTANRENCLCTGFMRKIVMRQRKITRERKPSLLFPINIKSPPFNVLCSQNFFQIANILDTITIIKFRK